MTFEIRALNTGTVEMTTAMVFKDGTDDDVFTAPVNCFYLHHREKDLHCVFDLGVRLDLDAVHPSLVQQFRPVAPTTSSVAAQLSAHGIAPSSISHVFISHAHFDHSGDAQPFTSASIIYGPGALSIIHPKFLSMISSGLPSGQVRELLPEEFISIPGAEPFERAFDYFGDGSLLLVLAEGHTKGHMVALVRTSGGGGRVVLAGDAGHHLRQLQDPGCMGERMEQDLGLARETISRLKGWEERGVRVFLAHADYGWKDWECVEGTDGVGVGAGAG